MKISRVESFSKVDASMPEKRIRFLSGNTCQLCVGELYQRKTYRKRYLVCFPPFIQCTVAVASTSIPIIIGHLHCRTLKWAS